jgi:hypothetical protein
VRTKPTDDADRRMRYMPDILPIPTSPEPTPADRLLEALGLETRATAEVGHVLRPVEPSAAPEEEHDSRRERGRS